MLVAMVVAMVVACGVRGLHACCVRWRGRRGEEETVARVVVGSMAAARAAGSGAAAVAEGAATAMAALAAAVMVVASTAGAALAVRGEGSGQQVVAEWSCVHSGNIASERVLLETIESHRDQGRECGGVRGGGREVSRRR